MACPRCGCKTTYPYGHDDGSDYEIDDGDRDRWFTAQEALEYGFVDHVRESAGDVFGGGGTNQGA